MRVPAEIIWERESMLKRRERRPDRINVKVVPKVKTPEVLIQEKGEKRRP
jgi:hypothetical protein